MAHRIIKLAWFLILLIPLITGSLSGCYYDVEEELYPVDSNGNGCDTVDVSYNADVLPVLENSCYVCHSSAAGLGSVVLEGYDNVLIYAENGQLQGAINHDNGFSPMPQGAPQLDDCTLAKINAWIHAGALNN